MSKDTIRAEIFRSKKLKREIIDIFGQAVEVRQPNLGQIVNLGDDKDSVKPLFKLMIDYCYVPGTEEKLFTRADVASLMQLPTGKWLQDFNKAIEKLTSIDVEGAEKNLDATT